MIMKFVFSTQKQKPYLIFSVKKTEIRKKLEALHGVTMMEYEWEFLNDQRKNREMYCEDFVDKKWKKTME